MTRRAVLASLVAAGSVRAATFPRPAPKLTFQAGRQTINLASYRGKIVVVEFLATTCPACQDCARILNRLQSEYGSQGVQMLGVAINQGAAWLTEEFVRRFNLQFPVGAYSEDEGRAFLQLSVMGPFMVPHLAFIDRMGMIQAQRGGEEKAFPTAKERIIRQEIERLLTAPAAKSASPASTGKK
jgi:peroxiredoxin